MRDGLLPPARFRDLPGRTFPRDPRQFGSRFHEREDIQERDQRMLELLLVGRAFVTDGPIPGPRPTGHAARQRDREMNRRENYRTEIFRSGCLTSTTLT